MIYWHKNQDGKALTAIVWVVAILIIIVGAWVGLTAMKAIKYPPNAVSWPGIGTMLVKLGADFYGDEETTEASAGDEATKENTQMNISSDQLTNITRDISFKAQEIEDLKGKLESKNDQIAKLEERIQTLSTQLSDYKPENRKALIKIYERMESSAAIEILSQLTPERAVVILSSMKDSKAAEILSAMDPDTALRITELMAGFKATENLGIADTTDSGGQTPQPSPGANQPATVTPETE
jgi:flagellar motility protein MotE (MotC chaperone)